MLSSRSAAPGVQGAPAFAKFRYDRLQSR